MHMATGTGKTGIIASLARCIPEVGAVLVLAPRIALCDQLEIELQSEFFRKLKRKPTLEAIPKQVKNVRTLVEQQRLKLNLSKSVIVSTVQMFESMIQAVTLLHGTLSTIGSIDAKLRIFCSP